jgi:single-strand DNA-binding protein
MNKLTMTGNLTKDIEVREASTTIAKFGIAVKGYKKEEVNFFNCVAFGKTAEVMAQYLSKGSKVLIEGSLKAGSYVNKKGDTVYTTDIIVNGFEFMGGRQEQAPVTVKPADDLFADDSGLALVDDGDIPF